MVDCYSRLASKMPENGLQVVMFTHQDAGVWAEPTALETPQVLQRYRRHGL